MPPFVATFAFGALWNGNCTGVRHWEHMRVMNRRLFLLTGTASGTGEENRNCLPNFFGSIAIARYHVRPCCDQTNSVALREYVRTIDQDSRLAARAPFEYSIRVEAGIASDIQAFGYHVNASASRQALPAPNGPWCFVRQDLYLGRGGSPFLVVHWKHTLSAIRLLDAIPGEQTRLISQPERR
jgi:hypothetical protein